MEIFTAGVDLLQKIVATIGGGLALTGIITFLLGQSESNAAQKMIGISLFIAGGGIVAVAITLVPMLATSMG